MPQERQHKFRTLSEWLILGGILMVVGAALGWARYQEYEAVKAREKKHLLAQIKMLDANLYQQLDALSRVLASIRSAIPYWQTEGKLGEMGSSRLAAFAQAMVGVRTFAIIDKQGGVVASSNPQLIGLDVSSRPYFAGVKERHRDGLLDDLLYVNAPVKTAQNQWLITFSRVVADDHGQFNGLVIASLDRGQFEILLSSVRSTDDMEVTLAHGDGINFMTVPSNAHALPGGRVEAGAISQVQHESTLHLAEEPHAGQMRLVAAKRFQPAVLHMDKPLLLALSRSKSVVYAEWYTVTVAWVGGYLVFVLCSAFGVLSVQGRRRELQLITLRNERVLHGKNQALEAANRMLLTQQEQLQAMVFVDGLTGIANRRRFDEALSREWAYCHRTQSPISLLMLDLDHFKQLNDHYGHQAGDRCLQQVAQVLQAELHRPHDLAARYGGEEFVCLLPECDVEDARIKAEQIRLAIAALAIPNVTASEQGMLTTSIGLACAVPQDMEHVEILLSGADTALYRAKANGRNCVISAMSSSVQLKT